MSFSFLILIFSFQLCTDLCSLPSSYFLLKTAYSSHQLNLPSSLSLLHQFSLFQHLQSLTKHHLHLVPPFLQLPQPKITLHYHSCYSIAPIFICADPSFLQTLRLPVHYTYAAYLVLLEAPTLSFLYLLPPAHSLCSSMSPFQSTLLPFLSSSLTEHYIIAFYQHTLLCT